MTNSYIYVYTLFQIENKRIICQNEKIRPVENITSDLCLKNCSALPDKEILHAYLTEHSLQPFDF